MTMHPIPDAALSQHMAVLGKTGSGKSFMTRTIVEQLLDEQRRVCILDFTGVWYGLRSSANGKRGAYPIIIFGAERKPLLALASAYPGGLTEGQWATLAGFKRSGGTWNTYKSRLRTAGYIEQDGSLWRLTATGLDAIGGEPPAPQGPEERLQTWRRAVGAASKLLDQLAAAYPGGLSRGELAARLGMTASGGTFNTYLSRLAGNGLVTKDGDTVRASDSLFMQIAP